MILKNRTFRLSNEIAIDARDYIIENFSLDLSDYDVIVGYRADDSYFSFAESFVQNGLPLRTLNQTLRLCKLDFICLSKSGISAKMFFRKSLKRILGWMGLG